MAEDAAGGGAGVVAAGSALVDVLSPLPIFIQPCEYPYPNAIIAITTATSGISHGPDRPAGTARLPYSFVGPLPERFDIIILPGLAYPGRLPALALPSARLAGRANQLEVRPYVIRSVGLSRCSAESGSAPFVARHGNVMTSANPLIVADYSLIFPLHSLLTNVETGHISASIRGRLDRGVWRGVRPSEVNAPPKHLAPRKGQRRFYPSLART